jgi:ubiquinone/menaquinone biosynthesis C-methylase UbiE
MEARLERMWLLDPEQFDPMKDARGRERIERTMQLILASINIKDGLAVADLGCGYGEISRRLSKLKAKITAADAAANALKKVKELGSDSLELIQECLPNTKLKDSSYDLIICTEVIAYLNANDYRLFFSELSRLVKPEGRILFSTPLDIYSESPLERLTLLAETELKIEDWVFSYHYLQLRLLDFFKAPSRFYKGWKESSYRKKQLEERFGIGNWWYRCNSTPILAPAWLLVSWACKPICHLLEQNRSLLLGLEKICRFFWDTAGISHVIFIAQRRPLEEPTKIQAAEMKTQERPKKREVWE